MTRLERKLTFKEKDSYPQNGIFGLMDGVMYQVYRITESELDKICEPLWRRRCTPDSRGQFDEYDGLSMRRGVPSP